MRRRGPDGDDQVPIACDLDAGSFSERVAEWRAFVASDVTSVQAGRRSVRLTLRPTEHALVAAGGLGQREKQCCAFFDVSIELGPSERTLVLSVPAGAEDALSEFVSLLEP
jgi:hypothetical protein